MFHFRCLKMYYMVTQYIKVKTVKAMNKMKTKNQQPIEAKTKYIPLTHTHVKICQPSHITWQLGLL